MGNPIYIINRASSQLLERIWRWTQYEFSRYPIYMYKKRVSTMGISFVVEFEGSTPIETRFLLEFAQYVSKM